MHRAESILQAVETTLTGLATTGSNVSRGRMYALTTVPALVIEKGADGAVEERNAAFQDRELSVQITAVVEAAEDLESALNTVAAEVYAAMMADTTLGLGYVLNTTFVNDSAPIIETGGELPLAFMAIDFSVMYRHSYASAES